MPELLGGRDIDAGGRAVPCERTARVVAGDNEVSGRVLRAREHPGGEGCIGRDDCGESGLEVSCERGGGIVPFVERDGESHALAGVHIDDGDSDVDGSDCGFGNGLQSHGNADGGDGDGFALGDLCPGKVDLLV